jgi:hypothetical protein
VLVLCAAGKKEKKTGVTVSPAILAGTVFLGGVGFASDGAEVVGENGQRRPRPARRIGRRFPTHVGILHAFAARSRKVYCECAGPAAGCRQEKQVSFEADERLETNFLLEPAQGAENDGSSKSKPGWPGVFLSLPNGLEAAQQETPKAPPTGPVAIRVFSGLECGKKKDKKEREEDENTRALAGYVRNEAEEPIEGAVVQLKDSKSLKVRSYITKADGIYRFFSG